MLQGDIAGQFAMNNLNRAEKYELGGAYGIRAYPEGEASGDDAVRIGIDLKYNLGDAGPLGDANFKVFYDWGHVQSFHDPENIVLATPNRYNLQGVGVGFDFRRSNQFELSLALAKPLGSHRGTIEDVNSDGSSRDTRVLIRAMFRF